jgi:glycerate kinase
MAVGPVTGPDGRAVDGSWLQLPDGTAMIELATASGLPLMARPDARGATTRGTGEIIRHALESGVPALTIALGGSATTDGGTGALAALGLRLSDATGRRLDDGGGALNSLASLDTRTLVKAPPGGVRLLTDVAAPLLGPDGAAAVFGPQKGADREAVADLERGLARLARLAGGDPSAAGMGAAGGAAYGFATLWAATITPGAAYVAALSGLDSQLPAADLVLTGEGRFDVQSLGGKVVGRVIEQAERADVAVGVIAGEVAAVGRCWSRDLIGLAGSRAEALRHPERWLRHAGREAALAADRGEFA